VFLLVGKRASAYLNAAPLGKRVTITVKGITDSRDCPRGRNTGGTTIDAGREGKGPHKEKCYVLERTDT